MSAEAKRASLVRRLEKNSTLIPFCGCRIWMGATTVHGYGVIGHGKRIQRAHRAAYELARGPIPAGRGPHGTVIRHTCDVPACINPDHLQVGTQQENLEDTRVRNRLRFGSKHHAAKLSESDVAEILRLKGRVSQKRLAEQYGVYPSVISRIYSGAAWTRAAQGELS
jgi:hypothetical protein